MLTLSTVLGACRAQHPNPKQNIFEAFVLGAEKIKNLSDLKTMAVGLITDPEQAEMILKIIRLI